MHKTTATCNLRLTALDVMELGETFVYPSLEKPEFHVYRNRHGYELLRYDANYRPLPERIEYTRADDAWIVLQTWCWGK